jgi:excinuclease ABC subunit C
LLKDDKHYPYIRVDTSESFPRVELVRRAERDGTRYFGPYPGATIVREVIDVVRMVFPIRTCNKVIQPNKNTRPCVHYEIGQCLAPCAGKVGMTEYHEIIRKVMDFLGGSSAPLIADLEKKMNEAAETLNYERAGVYRDRMQAVEQIMQKQRAIVAGGGDRDVLAVASEGEDATVQVMTIRGGKLIGSESHILARAADEAAADVMCSFMMQYYCMGALPPREILTSVLPSEYETLSILLAERRGGKVELSMPKRGEKRHLMDMALKNASNFVQKREVRLNQSHARTAGALEELREALSLHILPVRIEAYDISNTQGAQSVGSMVVMKGGLPANREYRRFRIKTVKGANDFASIYEVISRRFKHGLTEREERIAGGLSVEGGKFSELPNLVLIDGGQNQLKAALDAMHNVGVTIPTFGLAKRIDEIILPDQEESLLLDKHSPALHLIQRLRNEAHRFAVTYHRSLRGIEALKSRLDDIPGIGPARKRALLNNFETIEALEAASIEEICEAPGISVKIAQVIKLELEKNRYGETKKG